jgi:hypothetical protein
MTTFLHVRDTDKGSGYEDRGHIVTLTFAPSEHMASASVSGKPWVTVTTRFVASIVGSSTRSVEEAVIEEIHFGVQPIVGVGFTVYAHAPRGAVGDFLVHVTGV